MNYLLKNRAVFGLLLLAILAFSLFNLKRSVFAQSYYAENPLPKKVFGPYTILVELTAKADPALNPKDNSKWPSLYVYLNNAKSFDGTPDYGSCETKQGLCGTPNLYKDRLIRPFDEYRYKDPLTIDSSTFKTFTVLDGSEIIQTDYAYFWNNLFRYAYMGATTVHPRYVPLKFSFVYYNDFWSPTGGKGGADRNLYIKEFKVYAINYKNSEKTLLFSVNPSNVFYYKQQDVPEAYYHLYIDGGLVNAEGIKTDQQNGMVNAFDKKEVQNLSLNLSSTSGAPLQQAFPMPQEGSFNINVDLLPALLSFLYDKGLLKKGDINLDGDLNIKDLVSYIQLILKQKYVESLPTEVYNLDGQEGATVSDLLILVQQIF